MNPLLMKLLSRYMGPAGDGGPDTGGTGVIDRMRQLGFGVPVEPLV